MQGALTWRQLAFFEKEKVQQVNSSSSPNWLKSIDEITSATSGKGLLYFGDSTGKITIVNNQMEVELEFQAYSNKISQLKSDENLIPTIKVWNLDKIDKSTKAPTLTRTTKIQHGNRVFPVTCFAVLEALTQVAVGFENGLVILIRGDISRERFTSQKVLHEGSACITGLGFHEENSKVTLYIVTLNEILTAVTTTKDVKKNVLDELGCDFGCAILTTVDNRHEMVIGRNEAIYYYGIDGRGPCAIIDGEKTFLSLFRQYLIVVSKERKQKSVQDSNNTSQQVTTEISDTSSGTYLSIYDLKNKFIAYVGNFPLNEGEANGSPIFAVIGEWGELFVITKNKRIFRLKEIDLSSKLEILFKKNMYGLAIAIVTSLQGENNINSIQKTSENIELQELTSTANFSGDYGTVVEICRRYGDWLYLKGEFDAAIQQYLKTIGYLEPSYVIRKFLDAQRIHNLTSYLQALHEKGFGNSDHTTLLINCYTKLRDNKKLDIFLKSNTSEEWKFDVDTAIKVCRSAGYFEHALFLAQHYDQIDWYMKIQIEDLKEYRKTVAFLSKLPTSLSRAELKKYGYILVTELPMEMSEILIKLFLEIPDDEISPEEYISFKKNPIFISILITGSFTFTFINQSGA
ncbi:Vacuolar protein sorting-associated protein 11 [Clydaea vesicula]|uniref:Vacuolar protein sorting-associated protein 11 n=1 Tax=Clydaea vesicula TaxID=447962 RepID=A0AAD5U1K5_9FUNG|nr:Vacuolar protein sorting-associated protein 11 [Clydaea vesicula]